MSSFTWGTGTNDPVNGSGIGLNSLFSSRGGSGAPIRVLADGDDLADINATKSTQIPMVSAPSSSSSMHNKIITKGLSAVMTGSMNFTAGGYSQQPNNMVIVRVPAVCKAYIAEEDDEFLNNNFIENTPSAQNLFSAPNGDRIEVFFAPDDNGNISISPYTAGSAIKDVLNYHIANSTESVFYMINRLGMGSELTNSLTSASSPSKLVEGWFDLDVFGNKTGLQGDHTSRDWNDFSTSTEGHHKVMIFDMDIVATGSANHTYGAMRDSGGSANVENEIVIYDFRLGRKFMQEYRKSMSRIPAENVGGADSFEQVAPGAVTNLSATDVANVGNQILVSWKGPSNSDLSRYYVFISNSPFGSNSEIGDGIDNDGDGYIDEDPVGDVDGFNGNDDDADGSSDEDRWMYPEAQAKNQAASASVSVTLSTVNAGDQLVDNVNYYVGVVAVDKHGNEGPVSTFGPVQSLPATPGAQPVASVKFDTSSSNFTSTTSTLDLSVGNSPAGARPILSVVVDLGATTLTTTETASATQVPPANWTVTKSGNILTYATATTPDFIDPGETLVFKIAVTNAPNSGPTTNITLSAIDNANVTISGVNAGNVTVVTSPIPPPPPPPGASNNVTSISAVDAKPNTATALDGTELLLKTSITVNFTSLNTPNTATSIWYDVNNNPDGPGGSTTDKQVIASGTLSSKNFSAIIPGSTDAAIRHGVQVRMLVQLDQDTYTNSSNFYKFAIDDSVTLPSGLSIVSSSFYDVTVGWNAIPDTDFLQYDIYYSTVNPVTSADPTVTVTSRTQTGVQIPNLAINTTYYFAIQSRDIKGNVSGLSPQISTATKQGTNVSVTNASDGNSAITTFDGSAVLTDNSITVTFTLDKAPTTSSAVQVWFDVGNNPDGSGGINSEDRQIFGSGTGLQWQAVIPGNDPELVDQAVVKFVFVIDGQVIQLQGVPFRFKLIKGITEAPGNLAIIDTTGIGFTLTWSPIGVQSNFSGYRIYYAPDTVTLASATWDRDDDIALYFASASRTTMTNLNPGTQYRFKAAGVDGLGNVGPFSNEAVGTTGTKGSVLITELGIEESPEFIELEAVAGPIDISAFQVTDLDVAPVTLAAAALTLQKGERAVISLVAGSDETDATGDANGNGYRDIYVTPGPALARTTDEVVLLSSSGDTVDAVVYRGAKLNNIDATDLAALTPTHWTGTDSSGAARAFTTVGYARTPSIARKKDPSGLKLSDANSRTDWEVVTETTPGKLNQFTTISSVSISDTSTSGPIMTASDLSGLDRLKTGPYRLKLNVSQLPAMTTGLKFWYDTGVEPDGRASPSATDAPITISLAAGSKSIDTDVAIPEAAHGKEIRFIFSIENDTTSPEPLDELLQKRGGASYRFTVDLLGPDTPSGLKVIDKPVGGLKLTWTPISNPGDFANYILFYDTGAVTTSSNQWTSSNDAVLRFASATATQVNGLLSNTRYNFRLATADALGNMSGLSDTASETTVAPVKVNSVTATDGSNTVDNFSGSAKLRQTVHTIDVTFDRVVTNPVMYWNAIVSAPADGPGGNSDSTITLTLVSSNQFSCTIPQLSNDSTVFFVFNTDAGVIKNGISAFSYKVDGAAGDSVSLLEFGGYFDVGPNRNTSVAVTWTPIPANVYTDFREYRILYQRGDTVTSATASVWGPSKAPILSNIGASGTAVQNLLANDTYSFSIVWVDQIGNLSALGDTFRVGTINATPFADPATDGVNVAHALDGTEWLMKRDITVTFEFSMAPMDPSTVVLKWNVGGQAGDGASRTIPMVARGWDPLVYDGVIAALTDPLIGDGSMVQYALWADGIKFDNYGADFKFKVDATPPEALANFKVVDNGSSLTAIWTPTAMSDFSGYKIRYRPSTSSTWTYLDKSTKTILGNINASNLTFPVSAGGHYYVNAASVDQASHEAWQAADKVMLRGAALDPVLTAEGDRLIPAVAGQPVTLTVKLWDMNGVGWSGQPVDFTLSADTGGLGTVGAKTKTMTTGSDGSVSVTVWPIATDENYFITATSAAAPNSFARFFIRALQDERRKSQTWMYYDENGLVN